MKKILYVNWGGLGDHLQFSTLPEVFHNKGYDFYINDKSSFRSDEIYDLVWKKNPFVKGLTSENANIGHLTNWGVDNKIITFNEKKTIHENIELIYTGEEINNYPSIYYTPSLINELTDSVLVDLKSFSRKDYDIDVIKDIIYNNYENIFFIENNSYSYSVVNSDFLEKINVKKIYTKNIFEYCDLIFSCKKFVCLWSGSSVLASAIKNKFNQKLEIDCFKQERDENGLISDFGKTNFSFFWYKNINYIFI
jgi:hypothetical protein